MVLGEKNIGVVSWCFCRGFCKKMVRRTWFFDGENVVDV
jgi:hypothetical protein